MTFTSHRRRSFLLAIVLIAIGSQGRADEQKPASALAQDRVIAGSPSDYMEARYIVLRGSNEEIGRALAFLAQKHHGLAPVPSKDPLRTRAQRHYLEKHAPNLFERMKGAAAFFDKRVDDDSLDFAGLWYVPFTFGCSVVYYPPTTTASGAGILSRNLDFSTGTLRGTKPTAGQPAALGRPYVVEIHPNRGYASLALCCCDLLSGVMDGVNSEGLTVTCLADDELHSKFRMEPAGNNPVGLGSLQMLRHLLDTCATAQEAKEALFASKQYYEFLSLHYLIADRQGNAFVWEYSQAHNREYIIETPGKPLVSTNFCLHRHLRDSAPPTPENAKKICSRYCALSQAVRERPSGWSAESIKQSHLAADPSRLPQPGLGLPPARTLWHALYFPSDRKLQVSFYLGDRPDPEHPEKNRIVRSEYLEFALSSPEAAKGQPVTSGSAPAEEFRAVLEAFAKQQRDIVQSFATAKTEDEKKQSWAAYRNGGKDFARRVLQLATKDPGQSFVPEALAWLVINAHDTPEAEKAVALLLRDHPKSDKLAPAAEALADFRTPAGERLLETILDQSSEREVRGRACFALGIYCMRQAEPVGAYRSQDVDASNGKASAYFGKVISEYGDLKHWQGTLKAAAERNLNEIHLRSIGRTIPDVKGTDVDGKEIKLSAYRGRVVLLDFWGSWCPPCMLMVPHERTLLKRMEGRPFTILGVNADKDRETFKGVCARAGISWPSFFEGDVGGPIAGQFNLYNYPTAYLIDHRGVIRWKYREPPEESAIDRAVDELVGQAEGASKNP